MYSLPLLSSILLFTIIFIITALFSSTILSCELPTCCNLTMRNTLNPNTNFSYCIIVGILEDQGDESRYITRDIPFKIWNYTATGNNFIESSASASPSLDYTNNMLYFINQTTDGYDGGLDSLRNNDYDVFIADIWALSRRSNGIDFSVSYTREWIGLVFVQSDEVANGGTEAPFFALFDPFEPVIWFLAVGIMLLGGILLFAVELMHPISDDVPDIRRGRLVYSYAIPRSILRCFDNSLMSPFASGRFPATTVSGVIVIMALKFCFLIVIESYVANLASFLTVQGAAARTSLDELLGLRILAPGGGNAAVDIAEGYGGKTVLLNESSGQLPTPDDLRRIVFGSSNDEKIQSYVAGSALLLNTMDRDCASRFLRLPSSDVGTVLSLRQSPVIAKVRRALDTMILTLKHNSTMSNLFESAYLPESERCEDSRFSASERVVDPETLQLGVENMRGLFVLTIGIMVVAIISALVLRFGYNYFYGAPAADDVWLSAKPKTLEMNENASGKQRDVILSASRRKKSDAGIVHNAMMKRSNANPLLPPSQQQQKREEHPQNQNEEFTEEEEGEEQHEDVEGALVQDTS